MKVLMIGPDRYGKGGISTVVNQYCEVGFGKDVELRYLPSTKEGNKVFRAAYFVHSLGCFLRLVRSYDVIHIHMASNGSYARKRFFIRIAKKYHKPVIVHVHGGAFDVFYHGSRAFIQRDIRKTLFLVDYIIVLSDQLKEKIADIRNDENVVVLHNTISVPGQRISGYSDHNALFLGLITERKGVYDLLCAWKGVNKRLPDAMLYICGNGEIDKAREFCEKNGLTGNVHIKDWVTAQEKEDYFKKCSVFVLPSHVEAMPMSILEAMGHGEAVVATDVGGIPSMICDGFNGMLLPSGDTENMEVILSSLLKDEAKKSELGKNAYATVKNNFNIDVAIKQLVEIYKRCIKPPEYYAKQSKRSR